MKTASRAEICLGSKIDALLLLKGKALSPKTLKREPRGEL